MKATYQTDKRSVSPLTSRIRLLFCRKWYTVVIFIKSATQIQANELIRFLIRRSDCFDATNLLGLFCFSWHILSLTTRLSHKSTDQHYHFHKRILSLVIYVPDRLEKFYALWDTTLEKAFSRLEYGIAVCHSLGAYTCHSVPKQGLYSHFHINRRWRERKGTNDENQNYGVGEWLKEREER